MKVVELKPEQLTARIKWFRPILNAETDRKVEKYELQVCHLKGPLVTSIRVLKNTMRKRPVEETNFTTAYLKELEMKRQKELEEDEKELQESRMKRLQEDIQVEDENKNEFVTVSASLTEESFEIDMHAGAKYQCRVRAKISGDEDFCPWEMAVNSEVFSLASALPDPPFEISPAPSTAAGVGDRNKDSIEEDTDGNNALVMSSTSSSSTSYTNSGTSGNGIGNAVSVVTDADIDPLEVRASLPLPPQRQSPRTGSSAKEATSQRGSGFQITHDSIVITWKNGNCHGLPVEQFEIQCAKVREYRYEDVRLARAARGDVDEDHRFENDLDVFDVHASPKSYQRDSEDMLPWASFVDSSSENGLRGLFVGPQLFKATHLVPGATYVFRMKQRNRLGWSTFSASSKMIQTFPVLPPTVPELVKAGTTYLIVQWRDQGQGLTNMDYDVEIADIDVATMNGKSLEDPYEHCLLHWKRAIYTNGDDGMSGGKSDISTKDLEGPHSNQIFIRQLVPGTSYVIRVRVHTLKGWSTWSQTSHVLRTRH